MNFAPARTPTRPPTEFYIRGDRVAVRTGSVPCEWNRAISIQTLVTGRTALASQQRPDYLNTNQITLVA
jgi:hypothetical protein